jgi:hypothetical protein
MVSMAGESGQKLKFDLTDLYMTAPAFTRAGGALEDAVQQATSPDGIPVVLGGQWRARSSPT